MSKIFLYIFYVSVRSITSNSLERYPDRIFGKKMKKNIKLFPYSHGKHSFGYESRKYDPRKSSVADPDPGSGMNNIVFFFFGLKYLNSLMGTRDPGRRQFGSGMEKTSRIPDIGVERTDILSK
jgi:hypothetical protein